MTATDADAVNWSTDGPVATITVYRPHCRNAVDGPTAAALREAFERFEADATLAVAVFTGGGGQFCAGADLAAVADPARRNAVTADGSGPGPMGPTRMPFSKPVIAAVEGHAVAGGLELALARQIAAFPQACLRADRASALAQWDWPLDQALQREGAGGCGALQTEGLAGAARFAAGAGRHGLPAAAEGKKP